MAALLALMDPGDLWIGGRFTTLVVGLWETSVASALVLAGLALVPRCLRSAGVGLSLLCGAFLGAAVLFTPLALIMLASAGPAWLVAWLVSRPRPTLQATARALFLALLSAAAVCSFWLVPFLMGSAERMVPGLGPLPASEVWAHLLDGSLLVSPPVLTWIALVGLGMLLVRREPFGVFVALYVALVPVFTTAEVVGFLAPHADRVALDSLMLPRLLGLVRPLCFLACGHAVITLARSTQGALGRGRWPDRVYAGLVAVLLGGAFAWWAWGIPAFLRLPLPGILEERPRDHFERALDAARPLVGPDDRLALFTNRDQPHSPDPELLLGPVALRGIKAHMMNGYPASMATFRFQAWDLEALGRLGVTAVISRGRPPASLRSVPVVARFGDFEVLRVRSLPPVWLDGPGRASVVRWDGEEIAVRVEGSPPGHHLHLVLTYTNLWRQADGRPVEPDPWKVQAATEGCAWISRVPARNGLVVLHYAEAPGQRLGRGLSLGILGVLALVLVIPRLGGWHRTGRSEPRSGSDEPSDEASRSSAT